MSDQKVAVLGLGLIGSIWAKHYLSAGQLAASWSRSPKPNLPFQQDNLEECAAKAKALHLCLYDADSVRQLLKQLLPFLTADHLVIQSTTIDSASAAEFSGQVQSHGTAYLEAPFTGSKPAAEQKQTVYFLGGSKAIAAEAEPLLKTVSTKRFHIGTPAQAASVKLAMNLQIAGITEALCESITMVRQAGVSDDTFFEVMKRNVAWSGLSELKESKLRNGDFSPQFSVKNMHKDMRLAKKSTRQSMPLLETVIECLARAEAAGYGEDDFISLLRELRSKSPD